MDYSGMILAGWGLSLLDLRKMSNDAIRAYVLAHPLSAQGTEKCEYIIAKAISYRGSYRGPEPTGTPR